MILITGPSTADYLVKTRPSGLDKHLFTAKSYLCACKSCEF